MTDSTIYLSIMLAVIAVAVAIAVPSLFTKKCPTCQCRNGLDSTQCRRCGARFPEERE